MRPDIDDELYFKVKKEAVREKMTVKAFIENVLREDVSTRVYLRELKKARVDVGGEG